MANPNPLFIFCLDPTTAAIAMLAMPTFHCYKALYCHRCTALQNTAFFGALKPAGNTSYATPLLPPLSLTFFFTLRQIRLKHF
jgi:hypothetical protein